MNASSNGCPHAPRLLIVDDETAILTVLVAGLRHLGLDAHPASNGPEAVALLSRDPTAFPLALVDVNLRGMSGLETVAALRRINPSMRCCLMTGEYVNARSLPAGVARIFSKPFGMSELSRELLGLVRESG
jgi:CheY-like chemotaxis protein